MVTKIPRWVIFGGVILSFIAGYINAVGFAHAHAITHMTGLITQMSMSMAETDWAQAINMGSIIFFFFLGTVISGSIVQQSVLKFGRRYGVVLMLEAAFLFMATFLLLGHYESGYYCAALAMGLQNAMATTYSGALIRTTHLTGFVNDFGVAIGHLLRGLKIDWLRFLLYGMVTGGFVLGAISGTLITRTYGFGAIFFPASLVGFLGITYYAYVAYQRATNKA